MAQRHRGGAVRGRLVLLAAVATACLCAVAPSQALEALERLARDEAWLSDYAAAARAAAERSRPILVVFERAGAVEGAAVSLLERDEEFVDVSRRYVLARVESFRAAAIDWYAKRAAPIATAVVGADGVLLCSWSEVPEPRELASRMRTLLAEVLASEAQRAVSLGDDERAVRLYWEILAARPESEAVVAARRALGDAGRRGMKKLAETESVIARGEYLRARRELERISLGYTGTDAAGAAAERTRKMLAQPGVPEELERQMRLEESAALLARVTAALDEGNAEEAGELCRRLQEEYAATQAAREAARALKDFEESALREPDQEQRRMDEECRRWMAYGDALARQDRRNAALEYYGKVVENYPDSPYAAVAAEKIARLK